MAKFKTLTGNKPADLPDLSQLIERITQRTPKFKERFLVKVGAKLLPLLAEDIAYFTSSDGVTESTTREGRRYPIDQPLDELEGQLEYPVTFIRGCMPLHRLPCRHRTGTPAFPRQAQARTGAPGPAGDSNTRN